MRAGGHYITSARKNPKHRRLSRGGTAPPCPLPPTPPPSTPIRGAHMRTLHFLLLAAVAVACVAAAPDAPEQAASDACVLPFDVDAVPARAGGVVNGDAAGAPRGPIAVADKLKVSGRLALALKGPCPTDAASLKAALPSAKLVADGSELRLTPDSVKAKVGERERVGEGETHRARARLGTAHAPPAAACSPPPSTHTHTLRPAPRPRPWTSS